jgi:tryptophan synthase alpha chain
LDNGVNLAGCLEMTALLRTRGVTQPITLMGYYNPILSYGLQRFVADATRAGVDGLIVADLPPEEACQLEQECRSAYLALIYMLAPTSTPERLRLIAAHGTGFLYLVSITGVTGARSDLPPDLEQFVSRVRKATQLPLAVGFGISTPSQARAIGKLVEGVIVGSALIQAVSQSNHSIDSAKTIIESFHQNLVGIGQKN